MITTNLNIAKTILEQLGGGRFIMMTGSKSFLATTHGLRMRLARNKSKANGCEIVLNASDLYDVSFYSVRQCEIKAVCKHTDVYCDQLQAIFTDVTGLYTKL